MDELDFFKRHWNISSEYTTEKKMSKKDIYAMLRNNSSSILKTLFYISIFEFIFFASLSILPLLFSNYREHLENDYFPNTITYIITGGSLLIIMIFVVLLYKSYTSISATDHTKKLIENILSTIKTVNYYVIYNMILAFVIMSIGIYQITHNNPEISAKIAQFHSKQWLLFIGILLGTITTFITVVWVFYKLLYGALIKRLKSNYNDLLKLEH